MIIQPTLKQLNVLQQMYDGKNIVSVDQTKVTDKDTWFTVNFDDSSSYNTQDSLINTYYDKNKVTIDQVQIQIAFEKLRGQLLTQFQILLNAFSAQSTILAAGGDKSKAIFTNEMIVAWGNYVAGIASDSRDLSGYTEPSQITSEMFGALPTVALPKAYQVLFNL